MRFLILFFTLLSTCVLASPIDGAQHPRGFAKDTIIHTNSGKVAIENIEVGQLVASWNPKSFQLVYRRVLAKYLVRVDQVAELLFNGEKLFLHPEHHFYAANTDSWLSCRDLIGKEHLLRDQKGNTFKIEQVVIHNAEGTQLYDLSIEETETYFVGENGILTHNFAMAIGATIGAPAGPLGMAIGVTATFIISTVIYKATDYFAHRAARRFDYEDEEPVQTTQSLPLQPAIRPQIIHSNPVKIDEIKWVRTLEPEGAQPGQPNLGPVNPRPSLPPATAKPLIDFLENFFNEGEENRISADQSALVWNFINATQEVYPGTCIPQSFELTLRNGKIWVHPNASKHLVEYIKRDLVLLAPNKVRLVTQMHLARLHAELEKFTESGIIPFMGSKGRWQIEIAPGRSEGLLPVLMHAVYKRE